MALAWFEHPDCCLLTAGRLRENSYRLTRKIVSYGEQQWPFEVDLDTERTPQICGAADLYLIAVQTFCLSLCMGADPKASWL